VNKLDLLFDAKQFAVAFGAAIGESRSVFQGLSRDAGQSVAHAEAEDQSGSRSALIAGEVSDEG